MVAYKNGITNTVGSNQAREKHKIISCFIFMLKKLGLKWYLMFKQQTFNFIVKGFLIKIYMHLYITFVYKIGFKNVDNEHIKYKIVSF